MKSLVLKDLFNIGHNAKSMLFILVVFAVALIPFSGVEGYIFVCAILCSMMIVTTFSFDDSSKWTRYAMIMPVSKKELVAGKFMVLAIFCAIGSLLGLIIGFIGGLILSLIHIYKTKEGRCGNNHKQQMFFGQSLLFFLIKVFVLCRHKTSSAYRLSLIHILRLFRQPGKSRRKGAAI